MLSTKTGFSQFLIACIFLSTTSVALGQTKSSPPASGSQSISPSQTTHITPEQAQQLFRSVDSILSFDSQNTGLPIRHSVKRRLITRDEIERSLTQQLHNDRDAKRLEQSELVLKKFGLLDRDFQLQPFLIQLLREQIAGYYDDHTGTVNLLDWIPPDEQKPVLAHELTHALQDQHVSLRKWSQQSELSLAKNVTQDNQHLAVDEADTVRDAVVEGQAMAVFINYTLAPTGKNLLTAPDVVEKMNQAMSDSSDSPMLATAPLLLQRSLLFPYVDGLRFVRAVLAAQGQQAAYAGLLDRPPSSTYEIMTPSVFLDHHPVPLLQMPDIHPLIDRDYRPYDIGVMGEFDVQVLTELFGGPQAAALLTPAWRGGLYYTAQSKEAKTPAQQDALSSLALLYLSRWATPQAAQAFAKVYGGQISRKYDGATPDGNDSGMDTATGLTTQAWNTPEGPVLIVVSGATVFISESFPIDLAHKLQGVLMGSVTGEPGNVTVRATRRRPVQPAVELTAALRHTLFTLSQLRTPQPTSLSRSAAAKAPAAAHVY